MIDVYFNLINDPKNNISGYLPEKMEELSTGYDVRNAGADLIIEPMEKVFIPLGFRAIIPAGWYFDLRPRSSTFHKKALHCLYGVIDESYSNQWYFSCQYIPQVSSIWNNNKLKIEHGDRIAQIILKQRFSFNPIEINDNLFEDIVNKRNDKRGLGGFGSTGDK